MINTKVHGITLAWTWWLFAGDDKELRASCDHDLEFISRFTSSCPVGCYQCHWSIVYRPWPWLAARLPSASSSCPSKCHGWFPDSPCAGAFYSLSFSYCLTRVYTGILDSSLENMIFCYFSFVGLTACFSFDYEWFKLCTFPLFFFFLQSCTVVWWSFCEDCKLCFVVTN